MGPALELCSTPPCRVEAVAATAAGVALLPPGKFAACVVGRMMQGGSFIGRSVDGDGFRVLRHWLRSRLSKEG
jgi:hypothetical protein